MKKGILAAGFGVSAALLAAGTAQAADEPRFGAAGQLSLGSDLNLAAAGSLLTLAGGLSSGVGAGVLTPATMLDLGGATYSNNGGSQVGFGLAPAADYFVIDNLSVGLELLLGYISYSPPSAPGVTVKSGNLTEYGIAPRVGYNIPLTSSFSLWPKVFFEHAGYSLGGSLAGYGNVQLLGAYVPVLYHPVPHFYVGLGPNILTELGASPSSPGASKVTTYGLFASIGGWFKLGE
jgi:hypothetical protein